MPAEFDLVEQISITIDQAEILTIESLDSPGEFAATGLTEFSTESSDVDILIEETTIEIMTVGFQGPPGLAGVQNLFVQDTDPGLTIPGLWIQTNYQEPGGMTFWVEDGT